MYANSGLRWKPPTLANNTHDHPEDVADLFEFRGLGDDDIEETRPNVFDGPQAPVMVSKNASRSNEVLFIFHTLSLI